MMLTMTAMADDYVIDTEKLSAYDKNASFGFGASVTGAGTSTSSVTVESYNALINQLGNFDQTAKTIYVKGTITFPGQKEIYAVQNKTIIGLPGALLQNLNSDVPSTEAEKSAAIEKSGILLFKNCNNIIIRNLTFQCAGACDFNANDNLCLDGSKNFWVDHCEFQDGVDGNFDIVQASDNICVTWCRFRYLQAPRAAGFGGSSSDHRFSNLIGNSDSRTTDEGYLNCSFANCWWDDGCRERMPRVRFGKIHVLNCLYSSSVSKSAGYNLGVGYKSNIYAENCAFISQKYVYKTQGKSDVNNYTITGCAGSDDVQNRAGSVDYFIPANVYTYGSFKYDASLVQATVSNASNGAGATLQFKSSTGIEGVATDAAAESVVYYDIAGQQVSTPVRGITIQVTTHKDGSKTSRKMVTR